jgi:hypothetical protein
MAYPKVKRMMTKIEKKPRRLTLYRFLVPSYSIYNIYTRGYYTGGRLLYIPVQADLPRTYWYTLHIENVTYKYGERNTPHDTLMMFI